MATSTESPEAKELNLVSKVEFRIALADSESKLESLLKTYLAPLLLKLASEYQSVRNKVIAICQHINSRIKPPTIKLPVAALLKQFKEQHSSLVRHFDLLYIQQGIDRISTSERVELLPTLLHGLAVDTAVSVNHGSSLFNLLLRLLPLFRLPQRGDKDDGELRQNLGLNERPDDANFLAAWFGKLLLLNLSRSVEQQHSCPGLTTSEYDFLTMHGRKETWLPSDPAGLNLIETKVLVLKFLASGAFSAEEKFLPVLVASADPNSRLYELGEDTLKRALQQVSLEDGTLVETLFRIYFGTQETGGAPPVNPALQTKIITLLSKSAMATSFTSYVVRLVEEGINVSSSNGMLPSMAVSGRQTQKHRSAIFSFINWTARMGSPSDLREIAPRLVHKLREYIESQGWPIPEPENRSTAEVALRGLAYETVGLLARTCPEVLVLDPDMDLLRFLLRSLTEEASGENISVSVEDAISTILGSFTSATSAEVRDALRNLLYHYMQLELGEESLDTPDSRIRRSARYTCVRFANRCLAYSDVVARWIDLLAIAGYPDNRNEVVEEGKKGLDPYWYKMLNPPETQANSSTETSVIRDNYAFPDFTALIEYIFKETPTSEEIGEGYQSLLRRFRGARHGLFIPTISFCRKVLLSEAISSTTIEVIIDIDWEKRLDSVVSTDENARNALKEWFKVIQSANNPAKRLALATFFKALYAGLVYNEGEGIDTSGVYFVEFLSLSPDGLVQQLLPQDKALSGPILCNNITTREKAAHAFGILASHPSFSEHLLQEMLESFSNLVINWKSASGVDANRTHGAVLALGYLISRLAYRRRLDIISNAKLTQILSATLAILSNSTDSALKEASITVVDQLSLFSAWTQRGIPDGYTKEGILEKVAEAAKSGNEKAITALGHYTMIFDETSDRALLDKALAYIYKLHELRQPETHFTVGESLSCITLGWESKALMTTLDMDGPRVELAPRVSVLAEVLEKVLEDCKNTKPALRKASSIWLLCLLQFCGEHEDIQNQLRRCQAAFKGFLGDKDDLVQETASRGLSLVYERGSRDLKDDLVRDLVNSFTENNTRLAGNVTEDTELFEPGALPTGEGTGITTYKDILKLSTELNDPSLVYRFMSLASHNAIWTSRAGFGRFGLSNILSDSSVNGYLASNPKLYAKLYRYKHDPYPKVREAMDQIWSALVKDPSSTLEEKFNDIMEDLLASILGKEWRQRQASCAAIADLIQGQPLSKYENFLSEIWRLCFLVLDDIKESVRASAFSLARVLTGVLVRNLESDTSSSKEAQRTLENVIPFLLSTSGLEASAQEVQAFALDTLLQIIKKSKGNILQPLIPTLVEKFLGLLSSLEPQAINYLHLNASKYGMTEQKIDDIRLNSIRSSPMIEAIERCLDLLDEESMKMLVPSLENAMRQAVGLPSKVGCTRVLVTLSTRHNLLFRPYADRFLQLAQKYVLDRNDAISGAFATATGYISRLASDKQILVLVSYAESLYFSAEDERHRIAAGDIIYAISRHATDRFSALASGILPFVFIAKHDTQEHVREPFQNTWNESVGGSRTILLYLREIVALALNHIESPRWAVKHSSALAIADTVTATGQDLSLTNAEIIWPALEKTLGGKTWDGKETCLQAMVKVVKSCKQFWSTKGAIGQQMTKIMLRESKRNNAVYRERALLYLGQYAEARDDIDISEDVYNVVKPIVEDLLEDGNEMDIDSTNGGASSKTIREKTIASGLDALFRSINPCLVPDLPQRLSRSNELAEKLRSESARSVQDALSEGIKVLTDRLVKDGKASSLMESQAMLGFVKLLSLPDVADATEQSRLKRSQAALGLAQLFGTTNSLARTELREQITKLRAVERALSVQRVLDQALTE